MVEIRAGGPADVPALVALMFVEPTRELLVLGGGAVHGPAFQEALLRRRVASGTEPLVAAEGSTIVGFAATSGGAEVPELTAVATLAVRTLGWRTAVVTGWRSLARAKVDLAPPDGGLHLAELQVHPSQRGRGVGAQLLEAVEAKARAAGASHLSLTTTTDNPAQRLYARAGYELVREVTNARYERLTGSLGRVLMVKPLPTSAGAD